MANDDPGLYAELSSLITAQWTTRAIHAAVELGIPDELGRGPVTAAELARRTGSDPRALYRLLRGLVTLGICEENPEGTLALTALGMPLRSDAPRSMRSLARFWGSQVTSQWSRLADCIRTGKTASEVKGRNATFDFLAKNPEAAEVFNQAMVDMTRWIGEAVVTAYDFSAFERVIDVGGGYGTLIVRILRATAGLRGVVFDLPHCETGAKRFAEEFGVSDRCEFVGGSFFEAVPEGAGAYVLKSIIHDWDDERSVKILATCHRAMRKDARLLLVERVLPDHVTTAAADRAAVMSDLNMLVGPGGCERTETEFRELLAKAGFRLARVVPTGSPLQVLEAHPL